MKNEKILKRLYDVFKVNDETSPLKYTLEALMFDLEYRQKVVFPNNAESIELDEALRKKALKRINKMLELG